MKSSKSYLPRKLLAMALSLALAVTWMIPSSLAVYADDEGSSQQEAAAYEEEAAEEAVETEPEVEEDTDTVEDTEAVEAGEVEEAETEANEAAEAAAEDGADAEDETEAPAEFAYNSGSGTAEDPGVISDAATLTAFAAEVDAGNHVNDCVKLGADIDLSGTGEWNPIGAESGRSNVFNGTFDGAGHAVSGMTITSYDAAWMNCGLFSALGKQASVHDLEVKDAKISADVPSAAMYARAGLISGWAIGGSVSVRNVKTSGQIELNSNGTSTYAGGVIGNMLSGASIVNAVSDTDITVNEAGSSWAITAGGITASAGNNSVVANCAVLGDVELTSDKAAGTVGGLAGIAAGVVANSYTAGSVKYSGAETTYAGALIGQFTNGTGKLAANDLYYASDLTALDAAGTVDSADLTVDAEKMAQADMGGEAFADTLNGNLKNTYRVLGGSATLKKWVAADGKAVPAGETYAYVEEMASTTIGGITYFYADTKDALENAVYQAVVRGRNGSTTYEFSKADLTQVGDTSYYYAVPTGITPLSGTLYGYGEGKSATYKSVYADLGVEADDSYDAITSATHFTGRHVKDIPTMVTYGEVEGEKAITGLMLDREIKTVDATAYVEASVLKAAGAALSDEQRAVLTVTLKTNPMSAPSSEKIQPEVASAQWTTSRYGIGEFAIVPDESVEGYVWSEYWGSVYAATVSNGTDTVGAVHWIDLYGEAATTGPHYNKLQLALNNGESVASNKATVNRYAAFFDSNNNLKPGTYTIKVYAEGYETLTAEVEVNSGYVLMNIPYDEFYAGEGVEGVDAVSSATVKTYNQTMAGGSYHDGYNAPEDLKDAKILGVTYPVLVTDMSMLDGLKKVTDDDTATITVATGKSTLGEKEVSGKDLLFASGDYAYYVMDTVPAVYKTMSSADGNRTFSAVSAEAEKAEFTSARVAYGGHYTDIELVVEDAAHINGKVNAIVLSAGDEKYALRHVEDVWRMTDLGWNKDGLDGNGLQGKKITNVKYYVTSADGAYGVYSYDVDLMVKPFADAEVSAAFESSASIAVTGLPEDAQNPVAGVYTGRHNSVVIAENQPVKDGKISISADLEGGTTYSVVISTDNYADFTASAEYTKEMELADVTAAADKAKTAAAKITATNYTAASVKAVKAAVKALDEAVAGGEVSAIKEATAALNTAVSAAKAKKNTTIKVSPLKKTYTVKSLKKKSKTFKLKATVSSKAKATFSKVKGNKKITVSKAGKVTVKKGLKKGTYKVTVKVKAPATATAKAKTRNVTITIRVKK